MIPSLVDADLALYRDGRRVAVEDADAMVIDEQTGEVAIVFRTRLAAIEHPGVPVQAMTAWEGLRSGDIVSITLDPALPASGSMQIDHFATTEDGVLALGRPFGEIVDWRRGTAVETKGGMVAVPAGALRKVPAPRSN